MERGKHVLQILKENSWFWRFPGAEMSDVMQIFGDVGILAEQVFYLLQRHVSSPDCHICSN